MEALEAIKKEADTVVTHYRTDFIHDEDLLKRYPNAKFFYFFRSTGTHLTPLQEGESDALDIHFVKTLIETNSHHYFWDGNKLHRFDGKNFQQLETMKPIGYFM